MFYTIITLRDTKNVRSVISTHSGRFFITELKKLGFKERSLLFLEIFTIKVVKNRI